MALVLTFFYIVGFVVTYLTPETDRQDYMPKPTMPNGFTFSTTCMFLGPHGHQLWQFAWANKWQDTLPNAWPFITFFVSSVFLTYDKVEAILYGLCVAPFFLYWTWGYPMGEAAAFWCQTGVTSSVLYAIWPACKANLQIPDVVAWGDFLGRGRRHARNAHKQA
jgi:hypothetical protein